MSENKWYRRSGTESVIVPDSGKIEVVPDTVCESGKEEHPRPEKRFFTVNIKETLEKTVVVAAEDAAHAEEIAEELCNSEEIVLEYDHFSGRTTETLREADDADIDKYGIYNEDSEEEA